MKGLVATIALAASTSTEGQNVNVIRREGEDTTNDPQNREYLEQYQKSENVMQNTHILPADETPMKSEAESDVGVLSNNKEGVIIDNPRGQSFLDTPQYNQEVTQQGRRRLDDDDAAAATFQERCVASSFEKFGTDYSTNPLDSYVDCVDGFVRDTTTGLATSQTCGDACGFVNETSYKCCAGIDRDYSANPDPAELSDACEGFTGKGKSKRLFHDHHTLTLLTLHTSSICTSLVCKDGSCSSSGDACTNATIGYVTGPSCRGGFSGGPNSCKDATIGSLYKSCEDGGSCYNATIGTASKSCLDGNSCKNAIIGNAASSCENGNSCPGANIGNATLSCLKSRACEDATIGSVESSCTLSRSCRYAQLSGVDLIDSCQAEEGADSNRYGCCQDINGDGVITELIGCCNEVEQCRDEVGYGIYEAGCVSRHV